MNPKLSMPTNNELLSAIRLLVSEDQCEGRFVFNRQLPTLSKKNTKKEILSSALLRNSNYDGGGNSKSQLQTLLARAGHGAPSYKTKQLKNDQFRTTVSFNGLDFVGSPCNSKKVAEKEAATEALQWLTGETPLSPKDTDHLSKILKQSKKKHQKRT